MASGRVHNQALCIIAPLAAGSLGISTGDLRAAACVGLGIMAGVWLTPDLDIDNPVSAHWVLGAWFGKLPRALWRVIWWPYGKAIPHRSPISHMPVFSTGFRLLYLHLVVHLFTLGAFHLLGPNLDLWWGIVGLVLADSVHWAFDVFRPLRFTQPTYHPGGI